MKKVTAKIAKKVTLDSLAGMMSKGFEDVNSKINSEIENLAIMVAKGFERVDGRFEKVEKDIAEVKNDIAEVKENLASTRMDVLGIGDRFVLKHDFNQHLIRFSLLEQKVKTKK